ncbi:C2 calcium-dependent membrane targeting [Corchorus capsularis]|uniref:C2 calcium-dependent membrane targeting n=1 Tax=Corchorus capsularis TaxID=210143 RepID=A0A1R3HEQ0_COCAP|nr:C2 calcium-dependent membrane targeting [Corchorus capsularis]
MGSRRPLEITVISASDLKCVNHFTKMDVYGVVSINGDHRTAQRTPVDKDCGSNPEWNHKMKFTIEEALAQQNRLNLFIHLKSDRHLRDKEIGCVQVPIKELLDNNNGNEKIEQNVSYNVRLPNGKAKGVLNFSYKFGEKFEKPVPAGHAKNKGTVYPPPPAGAYPPPPTGYPTPSGVYPPAPQGAAGAYPPPHQGEAGTYRLTPADYLTPSGLYPPSPHEAAGAYPPPSHVATGAYPPPPAGYPTTSGVYPPPPQGPTGAYPPPPQEAAGAYAYPPPPGAYPTPPHGYLPQGPAPGYGYPGYPPQGGYGYNDMSVMQKLQKPKKGGKKSKMGMGLAAAGGLGLGLLAAGGLVGGMVIGDMVEDAVEDVEDAVEDVVEDAVVDMVDCAFDSFDW